MTPSPTDIKAVRQDRVLQLSWAGGRVVRYPFKYLRLQCRCAGCVDERTGVRLLDPAHIPEDISIRALELVGSYALKIVWTDGHDTGLYSWEHLQSLQPTPDS